MKYTVYIKVKRNYTATEAYDVEANSIEEAKYLIKHDINSEKVEFVDAFSENLEPVIESEIEAIYDDKREAIY